MSTDQLLSIAAYIKQYFKQFDLNNSLSEAYTTLELKFHVFTFICVGKSTVKLQDAHSFYS